MKAWPKNREWPWEPDKAVRVRVEEEWVRGRVGRSDRDRRRFCVIYSDRHRTALGQQPHLTETGWIRESRWDAVVRGADTDSDDSTEGGGGETVDGSDEQMDAPSEATGEQSLAKESQSLSTGTAAEAAVLSEALEKLRVAGERCVKASRRVAGLKRDRCSPTLGEAASESATSVAGIGRGARGRKGAIKRLKGGVRRAGAEPNGRQ